MICNDVIVNGVSPSFTLTTTAWKEFSVMEDLTIPIQKPDMKRINMLNIEATITEFEVVRTPITTANFEGVISTGYKLIVKGSLIQYIEYIADSCEQTSHSAHFEVPFCTYIVLPDYYEIGNSISVDAIVEDVYVSQSSARTFFKNVTMFVYANICCGVADVDLPSLILEPKDTEAVTIYDEGIQTENAYILSSSLPQAIFVSASDGSSVELLTTLPTGYTFYSDEGYILIDAEASSTTIEFQLLSLPCSVTYTLNVIIEDPTKFEFTIDTPDSVIDVSTEDAYIFTYDTTLLEDGLITIVPDKTGILTYTSEDTGYSFEDNLLTISQKEATSTTLYFEFDHNGFIEELSIEISVDAK